MNIKSVLLILIIIGLSILVAISNSTAVKLIYYLYLITSTVLVVMSYPNPDPKNNWINIGIFVGNMISIIVLTIIIDMVSLKVSKEIILKDPKLIKSKLCGLDINNSVRCYVVDDLTPKIIYEIDKHPSSIKVYQIDYYTIFNTKLKSKICYDKNCE